ncbi:MULTISPECIES: catalase [unclassified Arthrobacter]|uniref:catalase n=1 Tax=unclassified Arthrobacter TaxID=235627 RepID=UPI001E4E6CA6|nr:MULTISPECIES: catalase [unclassified Arthrobacter]MCC9146013.1 catalase [Arthrobacter sp. zg-Y919]MDK1277242.1 catalase [Arthrobacter sp. zg.Y919]MDM7990621.1 catalase [Arthrobacter sp. zg-Y877]WIB03756.1 catalase [Arthrobacter sp. zg-Y919]
MTDAEQQNPADGQNAAGDPKTLTTRQGHPVYDNQNTRTVGSRGPATLENYQLLEKISHFDRERIPERVVHARGFVAYGEFEATGKWGDEPIAKYTRAKLFSEPGKKTDVAIRFSSVIGGRDSSEAARDPRGFAVKFYTEDGNWDLVGNNLGVFFIRDAIKFPDVIHSLKPDPVTFRQESARIFDFMSQTPEAMHMLVNLFSPRGIPADYRHMQGFGVNTYRWVNAAGESKLVKYHFQPRQGVKSLTEEDAANIQANDLGHASKDLYEAIERGDFPKWDLYVQLMDDHDHPELDFDPLDDTKTWPEQEFEPKLIGTMTLNRNVVDHHNENEQIAFGTGVLVDGLEFSDDKMLVGRTFSYSDTQRYRVGPNYLQLPVNSAKNARVATNQRGGQMSYGTDLAPGQNPHVNYEPNITGGLQEAPKPEQAEVGPELVGRLTRARLNRTNDYMQAGQRYQLMEQWEKDDLVANFIANVGQAARPVQERMLWHFYMSDDELGARVGEGLGISLDEIKDLGPLATQTLNEEETERMKNLGHNGPRNVEGLTMTHCVPNEHVVVTR